MISSESISAELARSTRTLLLGGVAVIVHGLNRSTKDLELWIDPNPTPEKWAEPIEAVLKAHPELLASYLDDVHFLFAKVEAELLKSLPTASFEFIQAKFERFRSADTAFVATTNPDERVQKLGISILRELAQGGDPFAQERLRQVPSLRKLDENDPSPPPEKSGC